MIKLSRILLLLSLSLSCTTMTVKAAKPIYMYQASSGQCLNAEGQVGLNTFEPKLIFADIDPKTRQERIPTRNASCTDFRTVAFHKYLGVNYKILDAWDFRGSRFEGATLQFNFIQRGLFAGSTIEELSVGYGRVTAADRSFDRGDMSIPNPQ